ncbi:transcriptional regulator [Rhizobium rhizosphaerae]|uniref:Transcriptional regulator n=1 Tax=Xaviernesmea rhizosphaerae TaxID=1672749 RepID=A0A1Q9AG57_9HYPH|nr:MFS transporter [Xaviernesmea rhizosphaerae]OLP53947.1 transcriptional regulator [Xaviernesmea rhizosphaerae]
MALTCDQQPVRLAGPWGAVFSMALAAFVLIASEFMPVSLLPLVAHDLAITEGQTGQAISVSGVFAVITSLVVAHLTRRIDRRLVASGFTSLLVVSGTIVAFAPNYPVLMIGRVLLGIAIGGFWSMSTSIVMRLVAENEVPKALAWINGGNALAATISAPLGSLLGAYVGWRSAFFLVVPIALLALVWQWISLPPMPPRDQKSRGNVLRLLARRQVLLGMASTMLLFMGQFALFTYLRPYLETAGGFSIEAISLVLLLMGLAGVLGTIAIGRALRTRLFTLLIGIPAVMALLAIGMAALTSASLLVAALLVAWGFFGTAAQVGWGTWVSKHISDDAEAGGGLSVAVIQLGITAGAAGGGYLFDAVGWRGPFALAAIILAASSIVALAAMRNARRNTT